MPNSQTAGPSRRRWPGIPAWGAQGLEERSNWELIGGGQGIHWPDLDEDISVEMLLAGRKSGESHQSFQQWLQAKQEGRGVTLYELTAYEQTKENI